MQILIRINKTLLQIVYCLDFEGDLTGWLYIRSKK